MSNFKLTFKLKQHTPIIHFQHDETGATLRATELKPKLDKFILTRLGDGDYEKGQKIAKNKGWLIGDGEHPALDYKVRVERVDYEQTKILNNKSKDKIGKKNIPFFFGNMGREYSDGDLGLIFSENPFMVTITSFKNGKLLQKIKENISSFFSITNFGTRQSKGYGSYEVISITYNETTENTKHNNNLFRYYFIRELNGGTNIENVLKVFEEVEWFYKSLRSGINYYNRNNNNLYFKSALFMFLNSKNIQWDKKTIKTHYFNKSNLVINEAKKNRGNWENRNYTIEYLPKQQEKHPNSDILQNPQRQDKDLSKKLWKDLLGLSSEESWYSYRAQINKDEAYFNNSRSQYQKKNKENRDIDRLKSPILFKPIVKKNKNGNYELIVYFDVFDKTFEKVLGKKMIISTISKYKEITNNATKPTNKIISSNSELVLPFPELSEYKNKVVFYKEFLDFAFNNIKPKEHIKISKKINQNKDADIIKIKNLLINVYDQLNKLLINNKD